MPIIDGTWVPPSSIIKLDGLDHYLKKYDPFGTTQIAKTIPEKKEEDEEVPTNPAEAREGFTFGCDPELFIFDIKHEKYISAEGLIPGTKAEPYPVEGGAVQVDGMAAEFNIDPVTSFRDFNNNIETVMKHLTKMIPDGCELRAVPAVVFDEDVFESAPEKAKELGCSPDFNAWEGKVNSPPSCPENPRLRTASGHLHVGWTSGADVTDVQHLMNCTDLVKQFDWFLGHWSIKLDPDPARRLLYGQAGACRIKDYGVEYRVLSNFWVSSRGRRMMVWNRMQAAIRDMQKSFFPDKVQKYNGTLQQCINSSVRSHALETNYRYPLVSLAR